ncbi:MAG: oligosaccharide flippase family protein, partial [Isosphaeraceae bacterium]
MSIRRTATRNAFWNSMGMAVTMVAGFLVAPFLVHRLGETTYGLWILIASFTSYFGMLDLGVRGSVGRQIAFHRARREPDRVNALLSTATAVLVLAGVLALLGTLGASILFTRLFDVPPEHAAGAYWALWLVGLNLALWLPLNVFDATLWASERFDLLNAVDIGTVLIRTGLTFVLIGRGYGLVTLAWINLISLAGGQAVKGVVSFVADPTLRMSLRLVERGAAHELFGYSVWYFLLSLSRTMTNQLSPMIVGARLGVALVTPYSIASRLVGYAGAMIVACTAVLTPVATALHAQDNRERQRRLFLEGGKYCWVLALFFTVVFLLLGRPL